MGHDVVGRKVLEREAARMRTGIREVARDEIPEGPLQAGLAKLPEKYRAALLLHYVEGRTQEETARLLGCSTSAASLRLVRGREMLRQKLLAMGVLAPAGGIERALRGAGAAAVPVGFAVTMAKLAGGSLSAGAAAGSVSVHAVAWSKGAMHMMTLAKLKVAATLVAAVVLPLAAAVGVYHLAAGPAVGQMTLGQAGPAAGAKADTKLVTWPDKVSPVDYAKMQAEALARKVDVSYARAYAGEVLRDLEKRTGVRVAYAQNLGDGWMFTLEGKGLTVKEVLEKLAGEGEFELTWRPDRAVLTQKADDKVLADLQKQLASADRWDRCRAVWALGELADVRIYPLLVKGLADTDAGVVEWTLRALEKHKRMGVVMGDAEKDALVAGMKKWLAWISNADGLAMMGRMGGGMMVFGGGLGGRVTLPEWTGQSPRMELLAGTERAEAVAAVAAILDQAKFHAVRCAAARALGANRVGATELAASLETLTQQMTAAQAELDRALAAEKNMPEPADVATAVARPSWKARQTVQVSQQVRHAVIMALLEMQTPEIVQVAQTVLDKDTGTFDDRAIATAAATNWRWEFNLQAWLKRQLADLALAEDGPAAPRGGEKNGAKGGLTNDSFQRLNRAAVVLDVPDAAVTELVKRIVADEDSYLGLQQGLGGGGGRVVPVDDPAIVTALIERSKLGQEQGLLAIRSLGRSHDPRAAEALMELLKNSDGTVVGEAVRALGETRDPRALKVLQATVQEQRKWGDPEGEHMAQITGGGKMSASRVIFGGITNPRRAIIYGMLATRDPETLTALLELARNNKLDGEVVETARWVAPRAVQTAAQEAQLVEAVRTTDAPGQREYMMGSRIGPIGWIIAAKLPGVGPRCQDDPRWMALLAARAGDAEAFAPKPEVPAGMTPPILNGITEALGAMLTPIAEKALADLGRAKEEDLARATKAELKRYGDPAVGE